MKREKKKKLNKDVSCVNKWVNLGLEFSGPHPLIFILAVLFYCLIPPWILPKAALGKSSIGRKIPQEADLDAAAAAAHYTPHREMLLFFFF